MTCYYITLSFREYFSNFNEIFYNIILSKYYLVIPPYYNGSYFLNNSFKSVLYFSIDALILLKINFTS